MVHWLLVMIVGHGEPVWSALWAAYRPRIDWSAVPRDRSWREPRRATTSDQLETAKRVCWMQHTISANGNCDTFADNGRATTERFHHSSLDNSGCCSSAGMMHCGLGPGPSAVGVCLVSRRPIMIPSMTSSPRLRGGWRTGSLQKHSLRPATKMTTRYKDDDPDKGVEAQRPWCVYPAVAHFSGKGEHSDAANFTYAAPKE
jgi:hypothetical protein